LNEEIGNFWNQTNVLVTGGSGFIGSHVVETLLDAGANVSLTTSTRKIDPIRADPVNYDGRARVVRVDLTRVEDCKQVCRDQEIIISAAHVDGSAAYKQAHPASIFHENMLMTLNLLEAARFADVKRLLILSSAEVYPPDAKVPTEESESLAGITGLQSDGYAWSKRMSEFSAQSYAREYGLKIAIARPNNVYGPRDHFDQTRIRIIPAMIMKAIESNESLPIWGNGEQVRSFLYVKDLAKGLVHLIDKLPEPDAVNFAGDEEITIRQLAELILQLMGKTAKITLDAGKPSGPQRRVLDISRAKEELGWVPTTTLRSGLQSTIEFYREFYKPNLMVE
jgi:nucleoside-diphosphate-sugar epimerase